jgi:hypothetical protein
MPVHRRRGIARLLVYGAIALGIATGVPPITHRGTAVWRQALPADSVPQSIAEAELQGSRHPRSPEPGVFGQWWLDKATVGTSDRRCVVVGDANGARSGEMVGTPFQLYADYWSRGAAPKLSFATAHRPPIGEPMHLIVKVARVDAPAASYVFIGRASTVRWSAVVISKLMRIQWGAAATAIDPPSPGRWLLVASLGTDWGCFVLDLPPRIYP